VLNELVD